MKINPAVAEWQSNLAGLLGSRGKIAEARYHFEQSIRLNPGYAEARLNYARLLANTNRLVDSGRFSECGTRVAIGSSSQARFLARPLRTGIGAGTAWQFFRGPGAFENGGAGYGSGSEICSAADVAETGTAGRTATVIDHTAATSMAITDGCFLLKSQLEVHPQFQRHDARSALAG